MRQMIFRKNYYSGLKKLSPDKRLEAYDAIMCYVFNGELVDISPECVPVLAVIFDSIEADFRKYEKKIKEEQQVNNE